MVSLLLYGCSTRTNDDSWRNWRSGNGCWIYITDCRPRCLQHCVLETHDLLTSCHIWIVQVYTAGCLRMLEGKCSTSEVWLLRGKSGSSWPFPKDGSDWHYRALSNGKKTTTRIKISHTRMKLVVDLNPCRVFHCTWIIKTSMAGLMNTNNARFYRWIRICSYALMTYSLSFVISFTVEISPFSTYLIPNCRVLLSQWHNTI